MSQVEKALRKAFENWVNDYKNLDDTFLDYVCKHIALEDSSKEDAVTSFVEETFYICGFYSSIIKALNEAVDVNVTVEFEEKI